MFSMFVIKPQIIRKRLIESIFVSKHVSKKLSLRHSLTETTAKDPTLTTFEVSKKQSLTETTTEDPFLSTIDYNLLSKDIKDLEDIEDIEDEVRDERLRQMTEYNTKYFTQKTLKYLKLNVKYERFPTFEKQFNCDVSEEKWKISTKESKETMQLKSFFNSLETLKYTPNKRKVVCNQSVDNPLLTDFVDQINEILEMMRSRRRQEHLVLPFISTVFRRFGTKPIPQLEIEFNLMAIPAVAIPDYVIRKRGVIKIVIEAKAKPSQSHSRCLAQLLFQTIGAINKNYELKAKPESNPNHMFGVLVKGSHFYFYFHSVCEDVIPLIGTERLPNHSFNCLKYDNKGKGFDFCDPKDRQQIFNALNFIIKNI